MKRRSKNISSVGTVTETETDIKLKVNDSAPQEPSIKNQHTKLVGSYLERENLYDEKSPLRGLFTLFWVAMAVSYFQTLLTSWQSTGYFIGFGVLNSLSKDVFKLFVADLIMVLSTSLCLPLQLIIKKGYIPNRKLQYLIQAVYELSFISLCTIFTFTRDWYVVQRGIFILHSMSLFMKIHSYNYINQEYNYYYTEYLKAKNSKGKKNEKSNLNELYSKFTTTSFHNSYPNNLTLSNFVDYSLIPSLIYQLEYPRLPNIRGWYVAEKAIGSLGTFTMLYICVEHYLVPVFNAADELNFVTLLLKLTMPFIILHILIFYMIFECYCNGFAELTRLADRNFYDDWWNSHNFLEYSTKWNKPVHRFLRRHVFIPLLELGIKKRTCMMLTFFISAIFHEVAMVACFQHYSVTFFVFQMLQIPLITLMQFKCFATRPWIGNAMFWVGMSFGLPLLSILYTRIYRPLF